MDEIQKIRIAEICGAIIGDGWIQSNEQSFFLAGDLTEDKEYYDNYISKIISKELFPVEPREFPYWNVYGIGIYKREIVKKLLDWGLPKGKKVDTAKIPIWIINSNEKIIFAFLRGFFDTDGCVFCQKDYTKYAKDFGKKYHSKIRLRISNISKKLMDDTFTLCKKVGLRCLLRTTKGGFKNNRNNSDVYILEINELKSIYKWFNEIKPSNPKHTTKYLIWKKFNFCPPYTKINQRKDILKKKINPYDLYAQE